MNLEPKTEFKNQTKFYKKIERFSRFSNKKKWNRIRFKLKLNGYSDISNIIYINISLVLKLYIFKRYYLWIQLSQKMNPQNILYQKYFKLSKLSKQLNYLNIFI